MPVKKRGSHSPGRRLRQEYRRLSRMAQDGDFGEAEAGLRRLLSDDSVAGQLRALCHNDMAVLLAERGDLVEARRQLHLALECDAGCKAALANLERIGNSEQTNAAAMATGLSRSPRIAIASLLFNWRSSTAGGGCVHTVGLGEALAAHGCDVRHFYARCPEVGVGKIEEPYPLDGKAVEFDAGSWTRGTIKRRFHEAVSDFDPDVALITDAWSFKPHLAQALDEYPVWLRFDSQECLCPLNNCRLLVGEDSSARQCTYHQLAHPNECRRCLDERGQLSGPFHRMERELSGVTEPDYLQVLHGALQRAQAVLVVNPFIKEMIAPYVGRVQVVPPGVSAQRFPEGQCPSHTERVGPLTVFMAGVVGEHLKGFHILHEACRRLYARRRDFRLVATGARAGRVDEFTEFTGWLSQQELPRYYSEGEICVVPSLVQEGWPIVTVEAMAAARPVIASSIGGLQFQVSHGVTGLLFPPGDVDELCACLERLMDDPQQRHRMGQEARRQFEMSGSWEAIIDRHYDPMFRDALGVSLGERGPRRYTS